MALCIDAGLRLLDSKVMFIRLVKKKNDHVSVRIVRNVRVNGKVKQKTVCCVGHFHKDAQERIEAHKRIGEELIIKLKNSEKPALPGFEEIVHAPRKRKVSSSEAKPPSPSTSVSSCSSVSVPDISQLEERHRFCVGVNDIFSHAYHQLSLFDSIDTGYKKPQSNEILKELVLSRIHKPSSKKSSVEFLSRNRGVHLDLDKVYRVMDRVFDNEDRIKSKIKGHTLDLFKQQIHVAFFDVTTLYFESFIPDTLRRSGYSKDNKFKETQVVLALMTTTSGLPLGYELFPGNTYEGSTLVSAVNQLQESYDVSDVHVIADRAMFTKENMKQLDELGVPFIISAKIKTMSQQWRKKIIGDVAQALELDPQVSHWTKEYEYSGLKDEKTRRLVISYSRKRANKDKKDRKRLVDRIKKQMKNGKVRVSDLISNTGTKKYLKMESQKSQEATLDENKIAREEQWDGIYGVISNDQCKLSGNEVMERYRQLWQIEEAFRVNKHDLKMRPVYHWTPRRIKAHILICFMAYALVAFVRYQLHQKGVKMSFETIREELSYLQASLIKDKQTGTQFILPSKITSKQAAIYKALKINTPSKTRVFS